VTAGPRLLGRSRGRNRAVCPISADGPASTGAPWGERGSSTTMIHDALADELAALTRTFAGSRAADPA
jgi:hypothetical protein